jgi:hypothetical protein
MPDAERAELVKFIAAKSECDDLIRETGGRQKAALSRAQRDRQTRADTHCRIYGRFQGKIMKHRKKIVKAKARRADAKAHIGKKQPTVRESIIEGLEQAVAWSRGCSRSSYPCSNTRS